MNDQLKTYPPRDGQGNPQIDTCDEFPFAASYESGSMEEDVNGDPKPYVTSGAYCAQVIAEKTASTGDLATDFPKVRTLVAPTGLEPCVRGHIPYSLNTGVGSTYQVTIRASRLISQDPFWVDVK